MFLKEKLEELNKMYSVLGFKNKAILEIGSDIIQDCLKQDKLDIKVSRTGENELLFYREKGGTFNNIIIDQDCNIEFLHIPNNRSQTYNERLTFIENIDTYKLVSKL